MGQVLGSGVEFAGYRIEVLVGRGGMSEVYRAGNPRLGNTVAVKLMARELAQDEVFQERFVRESRLAASLNHPNVVPIFDAGEFEGVPYIAMRYVDGPDLEQLIAREGRLGIEYATAILAQVAGALDAAHAKGLIHRDVKPGNILIDEDAGTDGVPHVYLSDFGVAKHSQSRSGLTSTGHFVGTIDYISPEQIEGKPLDGTTDLYSLGCLLYECLTGVSPFDRDTDVAMIYAHLVDPPPAVSDKRPDLPAALDGVIAKALSKRPEDRYRTCRELVSAVRATYGADTAGFPIGTATAASSVASETVLATSTNGIDGPAAPVSAPPTTLSDEAPGAPIPVPPTALGPGASTSTPPTEIAGAAGFASQETAAMGSADPTGVMEEPATLLGSGPLRRRVWPRALVAGVAFLLLAGGAAAAVLITSSGKTTKTHQTTGGGNSGTQSDVKGGVVTPTVDGAKTGSKGTTTTHRPATGATTRRAASTRRTTSARAATTDRRVRTTAQATTTDRRVRTTAPTTTSSGTDRRRTTTSSGSGGGTTTNRRRG